MHQLRALVSHDYFNAQGKRWVRFRRCQTFIVPCNEQKPVRIYSHLPCVLEKQRACPKVFSDDRATIAITFECQYESLKALAAT